MIKKILALVLCGIMIFCFVACHENDTDHTDDTSNSTYPPKADETAQAAPVFETENIVRITFYGYYGGGKGSDVPAEYMPDITKWLGSFSVGEKAPDMLPPGTNTIHVEIEYSDGTVITQGLDTVTVDEVEYYTAYDEAPECYREILSYTGLS